MKIIQSLAVSLFVISFQSLSAREEPVNLLSLPGGVLTSTYGSATLNNLKDGVMSTEYFFEGLPNEIVFQVPEGAYILQKYSLTSTAKQADLDPQDWELSGSLDGAEWTLLQRSSQQTFGERNQERTFSLSAAVQKQPYRFFRLEVTKVKSGGKSCALSEMKLFGTKTSLPEAPSDARLNPLAWNQVRLTWRDLADSEDCYEIQRTSDGTGYRTVATVPANTVSYTDDQVGPNTPYVYRVTALKGDMRTMYAESNPVLTPCFDALTSLTYGRKYTVADKYNNSPEHERAGCAFDGNDRTKFLTYGMNTWISVGFEEPFRVEQYSITSANDGPARDPKKWQLEASDDGESWDVLDERDEQFFDMRFQQKFFVTGNHRAYRRYRLNILENNGDRDRTQLADWLLYADVPSTDVTLIPATPANFKAKVCAFHLIKLTWDDVTGETAYKIERYADGRRDTTYTVNPDNTEWYPYALKPETNYEFKLYAVNGQNESAPATVSARTPKKEWIENWNGVQLWINDGPMDFVKVKETSENMAFYLPAGGKAGDVSDVLYEDYTKSWEYILNTYGDVVSDPRVHVMLIPTDEGGGIASITTYRDEGIGYRNTVYIKTHRDGFKSTAKEGYVYDVFNHEACHINEMTGVAGKSGAVFIGVWGDSKWADIFGLDVFKGIGSPRTESILEEMRDPVRPGGSSDDMPTPNRKNTWLRDFWYPSYTGYGESRVLVRFWQLLSEHYKYRNANCDGGTLGELIHFWSGAAGVDVKSMAVKAFGWNGRYEMSLLKARADYPAVTYSDLPDSEANLCQNGGRMSSNRQSADDIARLTDNDYSTAYGVTKDGISDPFTLVYASAQPARLTGYSVLVAGKEYAPASWILYGSNDGKNWAVADEREGVDFEAGSRQTFAVDDAAVYTYFKLEFRFTRINQIRLSEVELIGRAYPSVPVNLRVKKLTAESVYLDWSCAIDEVESYVIERSENGSAFTKAGEAGRYDISFTDSGLDAGGRYEYRVTVKNKNPEKTDMISEPAAIDMNESALGGSRADCPDFGELISRLGQYSANRVQVYSAGGTLVFDRHFGSPGLLNHLQSALTPGLYMVRIDTGKEDVVPVSGKIIIN